MLEFCEGFFEFSFMNENMLGRRSGSDGGCWVVNEESSNVPEHFLPVLMQALDKYNARQQERLKATLHKTNQISVLCHEAFCEASKEYNKKANKS